MPEQVKKVWSESKTERTPAEWALRWILNHPEVTSVISGMSELEQVEENIQIANETLPNSVTDDEFELYDRVKYIYIS